MNKKSLGLVSMGAFLTAAGLFISACGGGSGDAPQTQAQKPAEQKPAAQAAKPATATLTGMVKFDGQAPQNTVVKMDADPVCTKQHATEVRTQEYIIGGAGEFANVFVYVKSGLEGQSFPSPMDTVVFDQKGCEYYPHIFGLRTNQPLAILNSDPTLHNVHPLPTKNAGFNLGMPKQGMRITKTFAQPEIGVRIKCDVHSWMNAYVHVMDHPFFAVTGKDGKFSIGPLPAGTYEVEAWHEKLGTMTQSITVTDNETKDVSFTFTAAAGS